MIKGSSNFNIICLETKAFYALIEEVITRIKEDEGIEKEKWIDDAEAMRILNINSKTTLQKYRDQGNVRYSQIGKKIILYDRDSLIDFIEKNVKDTI